MRHAHKSRLYSHTIASATGDGRGDGVAAATIAEQIRPFRVPHDRVRGDRVVRAWFGLAEFTSIRVTKRDEKNRMLTADETLKFMKKKERVDVDEEYKELMEKLDIDQWENKRGPRPWEDGTMDR